MGTRSKEATVILVDAGPSMRTPLRERAALANELKFKLAQNGGEGDAKHHAQALTTRFDAAIAAVESLIQQKLFFKPKDELGIVLFGCEETDNQLNDDQGDGEYSNVRVLSSIDMPTLSMCEKLHTLVPTASSSSETVKVDLLDGLIVALDLIYRRTEGKKYDKKLLVITDASSKLQDLSDVESVVQMIQNMGVKLQIIGIDFKNTTNIDKPAQQDTSTMDTTATIKDEVQQEEAPSPEQQIKCENEKMLVSIAKEVSGEVTCATKKMHLLAQGMKKSVSQVTKFRGPLEIGSEFGIPVFCYLKTKLATLPTLQKESLVSQDKEISGKVRMDRHYTSPQQPDVEISPDMHVKAYKYGMERVPFSSADVEFFKFQTEKSLKILGFVDQKTQLNLAKCIAGTDIFVAEPGKPNAAQALAALIDGMVSLGQFAVARFVARKNAAPKIMALIPHQPTPSENYYAFWGQQLPYEEDLRNYEFAPLLANNKKATPSAKQQELADQLVDKLSVKPTKTQEVGECFNPVLRRFFHAVEQRAMANGNDNLPLPPVPSYLDRCLKMDETREKQIGELIHNFGDAFQLKEAVKKQSERKKKSFWSDLPADDSSKMDIGGADDADGGGGGDAGGGADDDAGSDLDLDELLDGGDVTAVGSMNPIADFETLLELGKSNKSKLTTAVQGMEFQISSLLQNGNVAFFPKALQCLSHFRARSVEIHYASEFNSFFKELKTNLGVHDPAVQIPLPLAWVKIQEEGISLLTTYDEPTVETTPAQARAFLYGDEPEIKMENMEENAAKLASQVEEMEKDEDDMFADFE